LGNSVCSLVPGRNLGETNSRSGTAGKRRVPADQRVSVLTVRADDLLGGREAMLAVGLVVL